MQPQCMDYKTHTTGWSALICSTALLLFLCQIPVFAATAQPSKTIYVGGSRHVGDGLSADRPLTSINDAFKKLKGTEISEDGIKDLEDSLQKLTDKYIAEVDKAVEAKSKEVLTV